MLPSLVIGVTDISGEKMTNKKRRHWNISSEKYWWIPSLRRWIINTEMFEGDKKLKSFSSHAYASNKKIAFRIALKCPEICTVTCIDPIKPSKYPRGLMRIYKV
jgi:hypothetical protein